MARSAILMAEKDLAEKARGGGIFRHDQYGNIELAVDATHADNGHAATLSKWWLMCA